MNSREILSMKTRSTIFLQIVIVLIGIGAVALLLWEPRIEGRNANATNYEIYFKDPFLAFVYIGSIPFFFALYQVFKLLGYVRQNIIFTQKAVKALQTIRYCAMFIIGFVAIAVVLIAQNPDSENPGVGFLLGFLFIFGSAVIANIAEVFAQTLQNAVDIKSENDLTV